MLTQIKEKYKKYLKIQVKQDFLFKEKENEKVFFDDEDK
jgi:hypothetical protein